MENPDELSGHHDIKGSLYKRGAHFPDSQKPMDLLGVTAWAIDTLGTPAS